MGSSFWGIEPGSFFHSGALMIIHICIINSTGAFTTIRATIIIRIKILTVAIKRNKV